MCLAEAWSLHFIEVRILFMYCVSRLYVCLISRQFFLNTLAHAKYLLRFLYPGDILFLYMGKAAFAAGEVVVFDIEGREIPIVHRIIKVRCNKHLVLSSHRTCRVLCALFPPFPPIVFTSSYAAETCAATELRLNSRLSSALL